MRKLVPYLIIASAILISSCQRNIDLAGSWEFALDPESALSAGAKFEDSIRLPGTTDLAGKGNEPSETVVTVRLSRRHSYV
ncbi:MAG: hypothetical protein J5886_00095, partial [Bacteroidales bacterium]|nr:hypothetical protein [Bacteroidales bacterium]